MKPRIVVFTIIALIALVVPILAQAAVIPRYTVIPVVIESGLNSATNRPGGTFTTHCSQANCGGFPTGTRFVGRVTSVTPASGTTPGQIDVQFVQAILPDRSRVNINGGLTDLGPNSVQVDASGRLVGKPASRNSKNKFIAYGAGAGLLIGAISGDTLKGALIGAAAGWLYGQFGTKNAPARDVQVNPNTEFGIMLQQDVDLGGRAVVLPPAGSGPGTVCPTQLIFSPATPYATSNGVLMVPFRAVMDAMQIPFTYGGGTSIVTVSSKTGNFTHRPGSSVVSINGVSRTLGAPSQIRQGILYVPADFVSLATGRTVMWNSGSQILTLQ
jgi:hypothetical protein